MFKADVVKKSFLQLFRSVCQFETNITAVHDHIYYVYEHQLLTAMIPPPDFCAALLKITDDHYQVLVNYEIKANYNNVLSALLDIDLQLFKQPLRIDEELIVFHAAWVASGSTALLLIGEGGTGKSTLCYELLRKNCAYGSDEATAFCRTNGWLLPFARNILLKQNNPLLVKYALHQNPANMLVDLDGRYYLPPPAKEAARAKAGKYRPMFLFLDYQPGKQTQAKPLPILETLSRLLAVGFKWKNINSDFFQQLVQDIAPHTAWQITYSESGKAADLILDLEEA